MKNTKDAFDVYKRHACPIWTNERKWSHLNYAPKWSARKGRFLVRSIYSSCARNHIKNWNIQIIMLHPHIFFITHLHTWQSLWYSPQSSSFTRRLQPFSTKWKQIYKSLSFRKWLTYWGTTTMFFLFFGSYFWFMQFDSFYYNFGRSNVLGWTLRAQWSNPMRNGQKKLKIVCALGEGGLCIRRRYHPWCYFKHIHDIFRWTWR